MVRIGNILIDPTSIDTIVEDFKHETSDKERGVEVIQIIYKSGVVKNVTTQQVGMSYPDFINEFEKVQKRTEDKKLLKLITILNNGKTIKNFKIY